MSKETVLYDAKSLDLDNLTPEQMQFIGGALQHMQGTPGWAILKRLMAKYRVDKVNSWLDSDDVDKGQIRTMRTIMDDIIGLPERFIEEVQSQASPAKVDEDEIISAMGYRDSGGVGLAIPD